MYKRRGLSTILAFSIMLFLALSLITLYYYISRLREQYISTESISKITDIEKASENIKAFYDPSTKSIRLENLGKQVVNVKYLMIINETGVHLIPESATIDVGSKIDISFKNYNENSKMYVVTSKGNIFPVTIASNNSNQQALNSPVSLNGDSLYLLSSYNGLDPEILTFDEGYILINYGNLWYEYSFSNPVQLSASKDIVVITTKSKRLLVSISKGSSSFNWFFFVGLKCIYSFADSYSTSISESLINNLVYIGYDYIIIVSNSEYKIIYGNGVIRDFIDWRLLIGEYYILLYRLYPNGRYNGYDTYEVILLNKREGDIEYHYLVYASYKNYTLEWINPVSNGNLTAVIRILRPYLYNRTNYGNYTLYGATYPLTTYNGMPLYTIKPYYIADFYWGFTDISPWSINGKVGTDREWSWQGTKIYSTFYWCLTTDDTYTNTGIAYLNKADYSYIEYNGVLNTNVGGCILRVGVASNHGNHVYFRTKYIVNITLSDDLILNMILDPIENLYTYNYYPYTDTEYINCTFNILKYANGIWSTIWSSKGKLDYDIGTSGNYVIYIFDIVIRWVNDKVYLIIGGGNEWINDPSINEPYSFKHLYFSTTISGSPRLRIDVMNSSYVDQWDNEDIYKPLRSICWIQLINIYNCVGDHIKSLFLEYNASSAIWDLGRRYLDGYIISSKTQSILNNYKANNLILATTPTLISPSSDLLVFNMSNLRWITINEGSLDYLGIYIFNDRGILYYNLSKFSDEVSDYGAKLLSSNIIIILYPADKIIVKALDLSEVISDAEVYRP